MIRVSCYDDNILESYYKYVTVFVRSTTGDETFADTLLDVIADSSTTTILDGVSKPVFTGFQESSQVITSGSASGLQMDSGIVLTTGKAANWNAGDGAEGETYSSENTGHIWYTPGNLRLQDAIGSEKTSDVAGLEFHVVCPNGQLELEYQFGSEEYDEYVSAYNDGFIVLVEDQIVSLVPDAAGIVTVNSINLDTRRELFLGDNEDINATVTPMNQPNQVEFDGMTIRLKIHALVAPNVSHKVTIIIGDTKDSNWDSALFIKQGSLRTVPVQP